MEEGLFYLQLAIVILTFIQSFINYKTLKEMKKSREGSFDPLLIPNAIADIKGVFDSEHSYYFDIEVNLDLSTEPQNAIQLSPVDVTIKNDGEGPACEVSVIDNHNKLVVKKESQIPIIKPGESKQMRLLLSLDEEPQPEDLTRISVAYENVFGEKFEQHWDLELDTIYYQHHKIRYTRAKRI